MNTELGQVVEQHFGPHPAAGVIIGLLGLGPILGARLLGEFGDDPESYGDAKARKAYAGTAPITRSSGPRRSSSPATHGTSCSAISARHWAFYRYADHPEPTPTTNRSESAAPATKQHYDNSEPRWIGILHGCLKTAGL